MRALLLRPWILAHCRPQQQLWRGQIAVVAPQGQWLEEDPRQRGGGCTLAYFHHPLFTSGSTVPARNGWSSLGDPLAAGVDVVLKDTTTITSVLPQDAGEGGSEDGIRQFVVGTGGRSLYEIPHPIANTEVYNDDTYGVLELT